MRHSSLMGFLNGTIPPPLFAGEIADEVSACVASLSKLGGIAEVHLSQGPDEVISEAHLSRLLLALSDGSLTLAACNYIADAVIMGDAFSFASEHVGDAFFDLADDSHTAADVRAIVGRLGEQA